MTLNPTPQTVNSHVYRLGYSFSRCLNLDNP